MKERTYNKILLLVCVTVLLAYTVMPAVSLFVPALVRVIFLLLTLLLIIVDGGGGALMRCLSLLLPVYIVSLLDIIFMAATNPGQIVGSIYDIGGYMVISCVAMHFFNDGNYSLAKALLWIVLLFYTITTISTIYGNMLFPEASRMIATGMSGELTEYNLYRSMNIGGFSFVYEIVFPLALLPFIFKQKSIPRILTVGFYLLVLYCVYVTQFTIALLIVLGYGVFFFLGRLKRSRDFLLYGILLCVLLTISLPWITEYLSVSLDSEILSSRFDEMGNVISGSGASENSDMDERQSAYMMSINAFLSSPVTGTGSHGGGHSFFLDRLAKYGFIGLLVLWIMISSIFRNYIRPFKETPFYGYLVLAFGVYLVLIVFNTSPLYMSVTLLLPLISFVLSKPSFNENNNS